MNINLQQMAIDLKLTNIQIIGIHNIGWRIKSGRDDYSSYEDALSEAESKYLVAWLATVTAGCTTVIVPNDDAETSAVTVTGAIPFGVQFNTGNKGE